MVISVPRPERTAVKIWLVVLAVTSRTMAQAAMSAKARRTGTPRVQQDGTDDRHEAERPTGSGQGRSSDPLARGSLGQKRSRGEQPGGDEAEEADLDQVGMRSQTSAMRLTAARTTRSAAAPDSR